MQKFLNYFISKKKIFISISVVSLILFTINFLSFSSTNSKDINIKNHAKTEHPGHKEDFLMEHIKDSHLWHFATIGHTHITIPLPIIIFSKIKGLQIFLSSKFFDKNHKRKFYKNYSLDKKGKIISADKDEKIYDLSITKNIFSMIISMVLMLFIFLKAAMLYKTKIDYVPRGFWMLVEILVNFVKEEIAIPNIGKEHYLKFMPFLLTIFFFIWINNLMGLLPGSANVTGNISITFALAFFTFIITNINGNKEYWKHIFYTPGIPKWLLPIMIPVEVIGMFTKPFSLMIRLFANITAGHIILLSIINIVFIFKNPLAGFVSVPFGVFMFLIKLLVAFLQSYVFTLMSSIYFGSAVAEEAH